MKNILFFHRRDLKAFLLFVCGSIHMAESGSQIANKVHHNFMKLNILIELLSVVRIFVAFSRYSSISILVYGNSTGSGETAHLSSLVCVFAACLCDMLIAHRFTNPFQECFAVSLATSEMAGLMVKDSHLITGSDIPAKKVLSV